MGSSPTNPLFFSSSSPTNYLVSTQAPSIFTSSSSPTNYRVSTQAPSIFTFSPSKKSKSSDKFSKEPKSFSKSSKAPKSPKSKKSSKSVKSPKGSLSPVSSPIADECIACSNNPTRYMKKKAKKDRNPLSCEDYGEALEAKCNKHKEWITEKYCQLSCYLIGKGYEGDVCCLNEEITI